MGYTHNRGFSAVESGYAVGAKNSERKIISGTGSIKLPKITKAGAPVLTSLTSLTSTSLTWAKGTTVSTTLTGTATNTIPVNSYIKYAIKGVIGAACDTIQLKVMLGDNTIAADTKTTGSPTKLTIAADTVLVDNQVTTTGLVPKAYLKAVLATSGTVTSKTLSLGTLSIQDQYDLKIPEIS